MNLSFSQQENRRTDFYMMNKQLLLDKRYMRMARIWAENSYCERRKVGALLVKNKSPLQCSHTVRDEYTRGSTLLAIAYVSVNQATYLMVTESPDRIRATRR